MDMDNPIDLRERLAMAKALYSGMRGIPIDRKTIELSVSYSNKLFTSPWRDETDSSTQAYASRFFASLQYMGNTTKMPGRWEHCFDRHNAPRDPDHARTFISEFFSEYLHFPREHHNFVCQRRDVKHGGVLDFPIEYPIAVEFWAVYITVAGAATLTMGSDAVNLGPGSIAIIAPGCNCTLVRGENAAHWHYHWLSFRSKLEWIELLEWATELTRPVVFSIEDPVNFSNLTTQTDRLEATTYEPDTLSERLCNNIIENILLSLRIFAQNASEQEARVNAKVQGAVDYILNHYGDEIGLTMIADSVNSSPVRLSALFREHFGISVIKWRDQIRMQKAKELIIHGDETIGAIANRVGYSDALYFSRRFKAHFGVAPSHFRTRRK